WRTSGKGPQRGMLPPVKQLESMIGALGIGNDDTVVVVATGRDAGDLAAAARVFWTFRALGHEQVAILDGGLVAYAEATGDRKLLASGTESRDARKFTAKPESGIVADAGSTRALLKGSGELVDARSPGEYMGIYSGGEGERPGTIPGAKNLPYDWLTDNGSARLRDLESLKILYASLGVDTSGEQVHFCHTGNRAALTWFVSYALFGNHKASLYDASMLEWARRTDLPVEPKIKLCTEC
ncbi:MAG: rhodanese-like domain-containing protein, partial [Pseudomonadota bacterium]